MAVSFDGVDSRRGGTSLPPGTYTARVRGAQHAATPSGTRGVEVTLEVDAGEHAGARISDTLWIEKNGGPSAALPYTKHKLEIMGAKLPSGTFDVDDADPQFAAMCRSMLGQRVAIAVRLEPSQSDPTKQYPRVAEYDRPPHSGPNSNDLPGVPTAGAPVGAAEDDGIPF